MSLTKNDECQPLAYCKSKRGNVALLQTKLKMIALELFFKINNK